MYGNFFNVSNVEKEKITNFADGMYHLFDNNV